MHFANGMAESEKHLGFVPPVPITGGALDFDGFDDAVHTLSSNLVVSDPFTLAGWFRPEALDQTATLVSREGEYEIGLEAGVVRWRAANTSPGWASWVDTGFELNVHRWTHRR